MVRALKKIRCTMKRYMRCAARVLLCAGVATSAGCRYGEVGREGIACDYVVKEADAFARDFGNSLDCYVDEVRDVFGDKNLVSFFEPEGGEFYMLTKRMRLKCTVRSKS